MKPSGVRAWFSLVKFSHSIFALPFALISALVAAEGWPSTRSLAGIVVCAVAARTAAMAFNRWADRKQDAANPRTLGRELPSRVVGPGATLFGAILAATVFVAGAFWLAPLCGWLSLPCLVVLLGYSYVKRFSWAAHLVLGAALGLAPLGAWVAVRGDLSGDLVIPIVLAVGVLFWVAGFDLIYACQDTEFDRGLGLHSAPARFGTSFALRASTCLHVLTVVAFAGFGWRAGLGWPFGAALLVAVILLVWQHRLVSPGDLSRIDMAFFTLNGWVGVGLFAGCAVDVLVLGGTA